MRNFPVLAAALFMIGCSTVAPEIQRQRPLPPQVRIAEVVGVAIKTDTTLDPNPSKDFKEALTALREAVVKRLAARGLLTSLEDAKAFKIALRTHYQPGRYIVIHEKPQTLVVFLELRDLADLSYLTIGVGRVHGSLRPREEIIEMMADNLVEALLAELSARHTNLRPSQ